MVSAEVLLTHTLRNSPHGPAVSRILAAGLEAVEAGEAVRRHVRRDGERLIIAGKEYDLSPFRRRRVLAVGKAAIPMSDAVAGILGERLDGGLVITKHISGILNPSLQVVSGGHPVPDEHSLEAGKMAVEFLAGSRPDDLLLCLVSGGGSALMVSPVDGVSLADLQALTSALLACGARIDEINALRRRLERVKGGGVARLAGGAAIVSLILSDVVGNPLEAIASGPTAPDPLGRAEALEIVKRYRLKNKLPPAILSELEDGPETPKPGEAVFDKVQNVIVGSNLLAAQAALRQAEAEGFHPYLLRTDLQGEARRAAFELATLLRQARQIGQPVPSPACIVAGGETTVTLGPKPGRGGCNTELALAAVTELADFPGVLLATLATDGEDGPTDAAGAVVDGASYRRAAALGLDPGEYLRRNDSYSFFAALDDLLKPGPTGTNVNDLTFLFSLPGQ